MKPKTLKQPAQPITALAIQTAATRELTPGVWRMIGEMAPVMYKAHLFGVTSPDQAAAIMLKGYELGLSTTASFEFVQVIQGKPALSPRGAMALLLSNPLVKDIQIVKLTDNKTPDKSKNKFVGYLCIMTRVSGFSYTSQFTLEDATRAGLDRPDSGWAKYPENMCLWRAVGFAADVVFPDITAGMTTLMKAPEMYGVALSEAGDVIDATPVAVPGKTQLEELINKYGAETILEKNGGLIPITTEEIETMKAKLESAS